MISILLTGLVSVCLFMCLLWLVERVKREADIVDVGWTLALGLLSWWYAWSGQGSTGRRVILATLAGFWSVRLGWYLFSTRFLAPGEDGRYAKLRESWGNSAGFKFLIFFLAQGVLAFVLALPFFAISWHAAPGPTIWDLLALAAGIGAVLGEGIADRQLHRFRSDPKNKGLTCNTGLWRYSRHPNYFFEWLYWWSYILLLIGSWWILTALFSAALMLYLITKVTGIPPTEERALASRGDSYRRYQRTVSAFFPWPPKEAA